MPSAPQLRVTSSLADPVAAQHESEAELERRIARLVRATLGSEPLRIHWLSGQLGVRRFARVALADHRSLIARVDAAEDPAGRPAGVPPEPALEPIRALLEREGLPVPARLGGEGEIDLLEDAGPVSLRVYLQGSAGEPRRRLYERACDLVPALQRIADPGGVAAFQRRLDAALFAYKAELFCDWSLPQRGRAATAAERDCVRGAFAAIARETARAPARLSHRDLQSANLHVREEAASEPRLILIDLQGAFLAPPEYDLVCLLRDSYLELSPQEISHQLERVRPRLPDTPDAETALHRFDLLTLTRKGKDHARFVVAAQARDDARFLEFTPATVRHLRAAATSAAGRDARFGPLAALIAELPESPCAR